MSDYLPEEVVLEILHRLPVKSLIQFRSTSDEERVRQQKTQLEERVCQQKTLLQQQEIILKQQEITLKQQREEMAWQTQKMVTLKSQLAILIQQLWGQSGDMFSGARDQSATQVQQGSSSASQET